MFIDRKSCIQFKSELWRHNCYKISLFWTKKNSFLLSSALKHFPFQHIKKTTMAGREVMVHLTWFSKGL